MTERQFFHAAALTTEQVVTTSRCRLHAILPDVASTAGIVSLRNAPAAEKVGTPGTFAGTPSNAGGTLTNAASPYYLKVVAVDQWGELSAGSSEINKTIAAGSTGSIDLTWVAGTGAAPTSYRVYIGVVSNTYTNYIDVGNVLAYTIASLTPGTAQAGADTVAATSGTSKLISASAAGLLAAGKHFHAVVVPRGLVLQLANSADLSTIVYERY